jgi:hypothetical protein
MQATSGFELAHSSFVRHVFAQRVACSEHPPAGPHITQTSRAAMPSEHEMPSSPHPAARLPNTMNATRIETSLFIAGQYDPAETPIQLIEQQGSRPLESSSYRAVRAHVEMARDFAVSTRACESRRSRTPVTPFRSNNPDAWERSSCRSSTSCTSRARRISSLDREPLSAPFVGRGMRWPVLVAIAFAAWQ